MARWITGFIFCIFCLSRFSPVAAQTIPLRHFTAGDGLSSNLVYCIARESNGYLWLTTDKGISRYNGRSFKSFTTADGLPDNDIFNIREDYEGRLWLTTFNGTLCYYKDNQFHTPDNTPWLKVPIRLNQLMSRLLPDSSIFIQLMDPSKLLRIRRRQVKVLHTVNSGLIHDISILPGGLGYRLATSDHDIDIDTIGKLIGEHPRGTHLYFAFPAFSLYDQRYIYSDGRVFTPGNSTPLHILKHIPRAPDIQGGVPMLVSGNDLMVCSPEGLWINDSLWIPTEQEVLFAEKDSDGNFWFGTRGKGLYQFSRFFKEQAAYQHVYEGQAVYARLVKGILFFTNNMGDLYQLAEKKVNRILSSKHRDNNMARHHFLIDDQGTYFVFSMAGSYIVPHLLKKGPLQLIPLKGPLRFKSILPKDSVLYVSGSRGILKYAYDQFLPNTLPVFRAFDSLRIFSAGRIYTQTINKADRCIWFACTNTVYRLEDTQAVPQPQLAQHTFRQMAFAGPYFVGITEGNALVLAGNYKDAGAILDTVPESDCVWENFHPIDQQHILITTNNYHRLLTLLPAATGGKPRYRLQTIEDPFIPQLVDAIAVDSNNCYFLKDGNILQVATKTLFERTPLPRPVFISFQTTARSYPVSQDIIVPYSESGNINIAFDNINFGGTEISCEYSVSRHGQAQWIPITGNAINLSAPGFGQYMLKIRARTLSSGYCRPVMLRFTILKPFWATWWFLTLCALGLLALVWLAILLVSRIKIRKKQRQHDADMKYQQSEYKALNALMNPHFIFNSLNNIQGLINKDEKRIANEYLVIFSDLVRQNMHNVSKGFISLQQELNLVENYLNLEKLRFKDLIHYELQIDEEVDTEDIMIPPLMIQPLVENAVKHGLLPRQSADSKVWIKVYEKENTLYVEITDNGIGITKSLESQNRLHESFGLSNLKKRTEHLKKILQRAIDIEVTELKNTEGQITGTQALIIIALDSL